MPVGPTLRRGLSGEPATLDPAAAADTFSTNVLLDLYEGLTVESAAGDVLPGVASSWEVDPTGKTYTFHLRADARWSNGDPVRAAEFVAAWQRVVDPKRVSPVAEDLRAIAHASEILAGQSAPAVLGATAPDEATLVVTLEQPVAYFPQILAHPATFPIHSEASAVSHQAETWVSNGPYTLSRWQPNTLIELAKNPYYWNRDKVQIGRVEYQFSSDDSAQFARYRAGGLDMTDAVPGNALAALRKDHSSELVIAPFLATAYYGINLSTAALGTRPALRQALAMAIDRRRLVEGLGFGQLPAFGLVAPGTWHYTPQAWSWRGLSDADRIATARRLYAEAGYSSHKPLRLRLLLNANEVIQRTAVLTAAMWKETLGVETELTTEEYRVFLQSRHDKARWDVARLAWTADYNDASNFLDTLRKESVNNDVGYSNPAFDALLDEAAGTSDLDRRQFLLQSAEQAMLEDYPLIPLYHFVSKRLVAPRVSGVHPSPLDRVPSMTLSFKGP